MNPREAKKLGAFIRSAREAQSASQNQMAKAIGVPNSTIMRLERGEILTPRPDLLAAIAESLHVSLADVYALAGYAAPSELPTLAPYLRSKYHDLPESAARSIAAYAKRLAKQHGVDLNGPAPGEDEQPVSRSGTKKGGTR